MKGRALRRALATTDAHRVGADVALILDTTELVTPEMAYALLLKNSRNRPINWRRVEEYADKMRKGEWLLHSQGIILDTDGNILTGQKRLWAVIYSGVSVYMRISRGNPPSAARVIDRGDPQSARDLAARETGAKHSPVEASIARAVLALSDNLKPSVDDIAQTIERLMPIASRVLRLTARVKKSRAVLMILAAICSDGTDGAVQTSAHVEVMAERLDSMLQPHGARRCWGRGAAFSLALRRALDIVQSKEH